MFDAAISIYAHNGWAGLTFGAVARAASVGKAALYLRWDSPGELLRETLVARWYPLDAQDTGSLKGDLTQLAEIWFDLLTGPHAGVLLHLQADNRTNDAARPYTAAYSAEVIERGRILIQRALDRGDLPAESDPRLLKDLVIGGVINRISSTAKDEMPALVAARDAFITQLISFVFAGMQAQGREVRS